LAHLNGESDPSKAWMGLPLVRIANRDPLVNPEAMDLIKGMFSDYWDEVKGVVEGMMDQVNKAERFGPAEVSNSIRYTCYNL
jgi:hypothetical protein